MSTRSGEGGPVPRRSQLYVPANNEKMVRKAAQLEADSVVLDLEDAVPQQAKEEARTLLRTLLGEIDFGRKEVCVRINPLTTLESYRDLLVVSALERVDAIVVPKAEGGLREIHSATGKPLIPIVETARGLLRVDELASTEGVVALAWGAGDLAYSMGGSIEAYANNNYVRTMIVAAASAHGVDPIDKVFFDLADLEGFVRDAQEAKRLGFVGKQVVHPSQIGPANTVFSPSKEEVEWATRVLAAYEEASRGGRGAIRLDQQLVDEMHVRMAKRILRLAHQNNQT